MSEINGITRVDLQILDFLQEHIRCGFLDSVMPVITSLGNGGIFWICLAASLLFFRRTRKYGLTLALALIVGALICNVTLKPLVARIRPYEISETMKAASLLISAPTDFSFPSGHSTASFACATALLLTKARFRYAALALAILIAFSRLYLYVHYPTDVLTGIVIGICAGMFSYWVFWKRKKRDEGGVL